MKKAILVAGIIVIIGAPGLWFYGRPAYHRHKEARSLEQAKKFMASGDYRNASLSARQTFQLNPRNLDACRIIAELGEKSRSPDVLDWRRRIAALAPTVENKLILASTELRVQGPPYPLAAQTLEELGASAKDVAAYHVLCAELALKLNKTSEAAAQFEEASRLEPTNELHQLNLAVLRLQSTNASLASGARATLERLRASTNVGAVALRWLVAENVRRKDLATALHFSLQLLADPHSVLDDRLEHLSILRQAKNPESDAYLSTLQRNVTTNTAEVYAISAWMVHHGLAEDAISWLSHFPAALRAEQPVPLAFVDCYLIKKDWSDLETFLGDQRWGDLEFERAAFLSLAASEQQHGLAAEARWRTAVREAGDRLGALTVLISMASRWGQEKHEEDLLWQVAQRFPREKWALLELKRLYFATGNTLGLNKLFAALASYDPKDFEARNNLAATSLLLKLNLPKAHELAKEVYIQHPEEAIVISTYAYSLHLQGRSKEGLAALERLKPEVLENPSVALYYGVLLVALGETNKASQYLGIAQRAFLLPEEKALLAEAVKGS